MIYAYAATGIACLALGFGTAWQTQNWRHDALELERTQRAAKDLTRVVEQQDRALTDYIEEQRNAKAVYQRIVVEVDKIVDRPVYRTQCFDADGMRQLGAALDGRDPEPGPVQPVPAAAPAR